MEQSDDKGVDISDPSTNEGRRILYKLMGDFESLFSITLAKSGEVELRPMQVVNSEESGVLWFASDRILIRSKRLLKEAWSTSPESGVPPLWQLAVSQRYLPISRRSFGSQRGEQTLPSASFDLRSRQGSTGRRRACRPSPTFSRQ
jgi:hypothetical protein